MVFDLDPYIYSGQEKKGAEPELNRKAFLKTCDVALLAEGPARLALTLVVRQDDGQDRPPHLRARPPPVRLRHRPRGLRDARQVPRAAAPEGHHDGVVVEKRKGKIFFDHNQNARGKTLASLYSPRPSPQAAVSMPLRLGRDQEDVSAGLHDPERATTRVAETGDLWANILGAKHDLAAMIGALRKSRTSKNSSPKSHCVLTVD